MCTLVILRRPDHLWPLILGGNRDEQRVRPWRPPGRHWEDRPEVVAGLDELAGGSWMGLNDHGVTAVILNRVGTLGPAPGKRSRGELVLEALDHADATMSAGALAALDPEAYRPFNLIIADNRDAYWLAHRGDGRIETIEIPLGLSMITASDLNDPDSPRIARYRDRFIAAPAPKPEGDQYIAWETLLGDARTSAGGGPETAMRFTRSDDYGSICGSIVALPAIGAADIDHVWRFATYRDDDTTWAPVRLHRL